MENYTKGSNYTNLSNNTNGTAPCEIILTNQSACYCPKDFWGPSCQFQNRIVCSMSYEKNQECPYFNEYFYMSEYSGSPPCNFFDKNDVTIIRLIIK